MARALLFAYGTLQPGHHPPASLGRHWPDAIPGRLFDLGPYPAAIDVGTAASWIEGTVLDIAAEEIEALDRYEGADRGLYRRLLVRARSGAQVWVYEYARPLPHTARPITRWPVESE